MIGNVIQNLYLSQRNYPEAAALSFLMMALILAIVLLYIRFAGTEAFIGEEVEEDGDEPALRESLGPGCATHALQIYAGLAVLYMLIPIFVIAVFSFGATPKDKLTFGLETASPLEYWRTAFSNPQLNEALFTSLKLAAARDR